MSKIVVGICTYNRNKMLNICLDKLVEMKIPADVQVEVVVIDGSRNFAAKELVLSKNVEGKIKFYYFSFLAGCIAAARNKVLKEVKALNPDYIAFIDDDEYPDENWLVNSYGLLHETGAKVVTGPSVAKFVDDDLQEVSVPAWLSKNSIFRRKPNRKNGHVCTTCATNNVLVRADVIDELGLSFDETYKRMTGEDLDFFSQISAAGHKIVWCRDAIAYEFIGAKRANLRFILDRNYNNGYLKIFSKRKNNCFSCFNIVETLVNLFVFALIFPFSVFLGPVVFVEALSRVVFAYGAFVSLFKGETLVHYKD